MDHNFTHQIKDWLDTPIHYLIAAKFEKVESALFKVALLEHFNIKEVARGNSQDTEERKYKQKFI